MFSRHRYRQSPVKSVTERIVDVNKLSSGKSRSKVVKEADLPISNSKKETSSAPSSVGMSGVTCRSVRGCSHSQETSCFVDMEKAVVTQGIGHEQDDRSFISLATPTWQMRV